MPAFIDLTGQRFNRLVVKTMTRNERTGRILWLCECDCGREKVVSPINLRIGKTQSCGCLRDELVSALGRAKKKENPRRDNPLFHRLHTAIQRCHNPANPYFKNYGARGIYVCERWRNDFDCFMADMGKPPTDKHTLERIDNDGPYSPENCRWATRAEQLRNQRRSINITIDGKTKHAKDWASDLGISYQVITNRFRNGGIEAATNYVKTFV